MNPKLFILFIFFLPLESAALNALPIINNNNNTNVDRVFDVMNYGASPGGMNDNAPAFLRAWSDACVTAGRATVLIPEGMFVTGRAGFSGPCKGPMVLELNGVLVPPPNLGALGKEWIAFRHVNGLLITGNGMIDGNGTAVWPKNKANRFPPSLKLLSVSDVRLESITLMNSMFFHVLIGQSSGVTINRVSISSPGDSPNTDGVHVGDSSEITIANSTIGSGDDCISIGPGSTNVTVGGVTCGPGHGISVGSLGKYGYDLGVDGIVVSNCTLSGTANGLRIKTWRGSPPIRAANMLFYDVLMQNVRNPIVIDQEYCPSSFCDDDDKPPSRVKISNVTFENIRGTAATDVAINLVCSSAVPCDVNLKDIDLRPIPPSPGMLPTIPLTTCVHLGHATTQGLIFPPFCTI